MGNLLMKGGTPLVAIAVALTGFAVAASANATPHSKPVVLIAFEGPLSGGNDQLGFNMAFGVRLALNEANQGTSFGKLPFTLGYLGTNDRGSATSAPAVAARLVANKRVLAVVGPAFSGAAKAAEPTFHAADLATVSPSATNTALATHGWNNFFRVVANDQVQGTADANYAVRTLRLRRIFNVNDASVYGLGLAASFGARAIHDGATVTSATVPGTTACEAGSAHTTQYVNVASTIAKAKPALVFYDGYYCDFGLLISALRADGYRGRLMSGDGSDDNRLLSDTSPPSAADGTLLSCACAEIGTTHADKAFATGFTKLAHFAPSTYSAEAFDATNAVIKSLRTLFAKGGLTSLTRRDVVVGLHHVTWVGLSKTIRFLANGNVAGAKVYINRVQGRKIAQLGVE
jgi:branched-chain amino acid transport system substrate-binding protein